METTATLGLPRSLVVKNPPVNAGDARDPGFIPGPEDSLEEGMATRSSTLTWRIPWTEEPSGLQSIRSQRVGLYWGACGILVPRPATSDGTWPPAIKAWSSQRVSLDGIILSFLVPSGLNLLTGLGGSLTFSLCLCPSQNPPNSQPGQHFLLNRDSSRPQLRKIWAVSEQMMAIIIFKGIVFTWEGTWGGTTALHEYLWRSKDAVFAGCVRRWLKAEPLS